MKQKISQVGAIDPVSRSRLEDELIPERLVRKWNGLEIYIATEWSERIRARVYALRRDGL